LLTRVVGHLPHPQPLAIVSSDGWVLAANRPLLEVLGCGEREVVGAPWALFLPAWATRDHLGDRLECFEAWLVTPRQGRKVWVHVLADPLCEEAVAQAHAVFLTVQPQREAPRLAMAG
jgi:PAS domain-containing protein